MPETRSTCPYCGVGCGVVIETDGERITGVRGDPDHPANFGKLCTKGSTLHLTASPAITAQARLLQPLHRAQRGGPARPLGWDAALDLAAGTLHRIARDHGPDAIGLYVSGQLLTEDYYVFNKLAKGLLGTNNIDTNSRLCMSSAVAGYKRTLGADAPPACYEDIEQADCLFIAGSNMAWAHPVLFRRLEEARARRPGTKLVVVDPRRTDTCAQADLHLAIQPGTDVLLFHGLLHVMLWEGWTDPAYIAAHTSGFDALKALVRDATPAAVAAGCGIRADDLVTAARWFATSPATLSLYCQGLNQSSSGTAKNAALINLHLATGQIGRPGTGPFSLTGQPNAMGGREVGGLATLLSAHRDLANPAHRAEVAALWGVPSVPERPGRTAVEMFQAAADGEIKALWIACTNPLQSLPDQATVRRAVERAEFVLVQEAFATTATARHADLLLPATTWGEKDGTVTNSERRISRVRPAVAAPGQARHDWRIAVDVARRLEALQGRAATLFPYETPEQVWTEHRASTAGRDLDITGLTYAILEAQGPQQWPFPAGATQGRARLYTDGRYATPDGRARFDATPFQPVAEPRDARYPVALLTGRLRDQWHGASRTGQLGRLFGHAPEPALQLHPQDMARRGLGPGALAHVTSRRGSIVVPVQPDAGLQPSQAFLAMHWGEEFLSGRSATGQPLTGVNALTTGAACPLSQQPELKHAAVKVLKAELPWSLLALAWLPEDEALRARARLAPLLAEFPYASCVPFGRERHGVLLRAAAHEPPDERLLAQVEVLLGLDGPQVLRYADPRRGQRRALRLRTAGGERRLDALLLAGDTAAGTWMQPLLQLEQPVALDARQLLAAPPRPPVAQPPAAPQVCTCFDVREDAIRAALRGCAGSEDARLAALQGQLRCGTNCGSCIPQLRRLVQEVEAPAPVPTHSASHPSPVIPANAGIQ
jgi:assimilatory nitrate reductase catalytic subunit